MGLTAMLLCYLATIFISASFASSHSIDPDRVKRQEDSNVNVVRYLRKYRYLTDQLDYDSEIEPDEGEFNESVRIFQTYFGLEQTGIIDEASLGVMRQSRCGCQDYFTTWMNTTTRDRIRRFAQYQPVEFRARTGWRMTNLRWRLLRSTRQSIPPQIVRAEIIRAFALWAEVTPLTFEEVFEEPVDIEIDFVIRAHGDGSPFDGVGGVLAHAFFPNLGTTHFDDDERWGTNVSSRTDLFIVAAHEFGHALGLDHTNVRGALMFPTYLGYVPNFQLHPDDIAGIQSLYGRRTTPTRPPRVTTTTTTTTPRPTTRPRPTRPLPTRPPTRLPTRPPTGRSCRSFDAAFQDDNGDLFMIRFGYIYSVPAYMSERRRATEIFHRIMYRPDAAFQIPGATFVIRRRRLQKFGRADGRLLGRRVLLADTFTALRRLPRRARITAAVALTQNRIMLFGRLGRRGLGRVWDFNYNTNTLWNERPMRNAFPGVPDIVDMAISLNPNEIIFVRGYEYFKYDVPTRNVEGPFDFGATFLGGECAPQ